MAETIKLIYDQIFDGVLPPSAAREKFDRELEEIIGPLKRRTDFEALADICYSMTASGQEYGFNCGFKRGVLLMAECMA